MSKRDKPMQRGSAGASLAEFGPVLVVFILIIILPLLNLLYLAAGYAAVASIVQGSAADAANSATFDQALANVQKRALSVVHSPLGEFVKLRPSGGYHGCGVDLFIATASLANTNIGQLYGPNTGLPPGTMANATSNIYQYTLKSSFDVGPCMDLGHLPVVGDLPLVGKAGRVEMSTSRAAEHTDGLSLETSFQSTVRH